MPTKIFIGNVSEDTRTEELRGLFEKFGRVAECDILKNYGFVHMFNEDEASEAINGLDNHLLNGSKIHVEKSHGRASRGGRGGGRGGFRGGRGGGRDRDYGRPRYDDYRGRDSYSRPPPYERSGRYAAYDPYDRRPPPRDSYRDRSPRRMPTNEAYYRRSPPRSGGGRYAYDAYEYGRRRMSPPPRSAPRRDRPY